MTSRERAHAVMNALDVRCAEQYTGGFGRRHPHDSKCDAITAAIEAAEADACARQARRLLGRLQRRRRACCVRVRTQHREAAVTKGATMATSDIDLSDPTNPRTVAHDFCVSFGSGMIVLCPALRDDPRERHSPACLRLQDWMFAVRDAATARERERCAKIARHYLADARGDMELGMRPLRADTVAVNIALEIEEPTP